jgi:hypothetical protein
MVMIDEVRKLQGAQPVEPLGTMDTPEPEPGFELRWQTAPVLELQRTIDGLEAQLLTVTAERNAADLKLANWRNTAALEDEPDDTVAGWRFEVARYSDIGERVADHARRIFEHCGAAGDFCLHNSGLVFGGVNRIKLEPWGWIAERSHCTDAFLTAFVTMQHDKGGQQ